MLTGSEIRSKFLDFFVQKGHKEVHSSSLVPANDPTLLFTNAGMNQFKDVFLGLEKRDYTRATTSQKCVRAGGKHNDLENVGFTNRHHTFFEMLGNFSFGDYFKKDAIAYAWELITSPEWFGIAKEKLYVTIFNGEGGVPARRGGLRLMGGAGRAERSHLRDGAEGQLLADGRYRAVRPVQRDSLRHGRGGVGSGTRGLRVPATAGGMSRFGIWCSCSSTAMPAGKLNPLPKPSIDTGMGLERVTAVLQGVISNYETDLFTPLIKRAAELTGEGFARPDSRGRLSLRKQTENPSHVGTAAPAVWPSKARQALQPQSGSFVAGDRGPLASSNVSDFRWRAAGE